MKSSPAILCLCLVVACGCSVGKSLQIPSPAASPAETAEVPIQSARSTRPPMVEDAESMSAAGAYARAAVLYRRAVAAAPRHPQAPTWYLLAGKARLEHAAVRRRVEDRRNTYYEAAVYLARAIIRYPGGGEATAEAMYRAGKAYIRAGQDLEAYGIWQRLTASRPDSEWSGRARHGMADLQLTAAQKQNTRNAYRVPRRQQAANQPPADQPTINPAVQQYVADLNKMPAPQAFQVSAQLFRRAAELSDDQEKKRRFSLLAGLATIRQAQATGDKTQQKQLLATAAEELTEVANRHKDHAETAAEALYWASHCQAARGQYQAAYRLGKRLVWNYPESQWVKPSRELSREQLLLILQELEHD